MMGTASPPVRLPREATPEILIPGAAPARTVDVFSLRHPFTTERDRLVMPEGATLAEMIAAVGFPAWLAPRVFIDGTLVAREWWPRVRPRHGHVVTIRAVPVGGGGGGGGGGKDIGQIVAMIAIVVVAAVASYYLGPLVAGILPAVLAPLAGTLVFTAVSMVGGLLLNALAPPQVPKMGALSGFSIGNGSGLTANATASGAAGAESPTLSITGTRNQASPYGPVPRPYGTHRVFPLLAANTFTEIVGSDQYFRMLFVCGHGPLDITDLRIGNTPLGAFAGVDVEVRGGNVGDAPITLYPGSVTEDALSIALTNSGGVQSRRSHDNADELSVDIVFPNGLVTFDTTTGAKTERTVSVEVQYSPAGAGAWTSVGTIDVTAATATQVRRGLRWTVARGTYDVSLRRTTSDADDVAIHDVTFWSALRTIRVAEPSTLPGIAKIALRIKATDQLNGVIDSLNCIVTSKLKIATGNGNWQDDYPTGNPASVFRDILQGAANARPVADARLDLDTLELWAAECAAKSFSFNAIIDYRTTVFDLLRDVCAVGRAGFAMKDGKYSVVRDVAQATPVQHFTPRNSWGFRSTKAFPDVPHALKVRFVNPAKDWQQDEVIVYDDGYSAATASKFEVMELVGVTSSDHAWKLGRYNIAVGRLRPELYELNTDVEHLVCTRGDLVKVIHDVPLWGLGAARVASVTIDGGGNATAITVDAVMTMVTGTGYAVRIRRSTGASVVQQVVTVNGDNTTLTFTAAIAAANAPALGDLVLFGELNKESVSLLVSAIEPGPDLSARLRFVDAAPAVLTADSGTIPPFDSQITIPPILNRAPAAPVVAGLISDETVLVGTGFGAQARIVMTLHFVSRALAMVGTVEAQFRRAGSSDDWTRIAVPVTGDTGEVSIMPVDEAVTYEIRVRTISTRFDTSDWVMVTHTVIGRSTPPPDVTNFRIEGATLRWLYPNPPADFVGFRLREQMGDNRVWETAWALLDGLLGSSQFTLATELGPRTYLLKAVDAAGNESVHAAVIVVDLGDPVIANVVDTEDLKAEGFPGIVTNGSVSGGNLVAADTGGLFWGANNQPFWGADYAVFWHVTYAAMTYVASITPASIDVPCDLVLDLTVSAAAWHVDYAPDDPNPFWSPDTAAAFWGPSASLFWRPPSNYARWPGRLPNITRQQYLIRVTTDDGPQGVISGFTAIFDVPDESESIKDAAIAAGGTRLTLTKAYRQIKVVNLTLQDIGTGAVSVKGFDKDYVQGPLVKCFNTAGADVAGSVDAVIQGIKA